MIAQPFRVSSLFVATCLAASLGASLLRAQPQVSQAPTSRPQTLPTFDALVAAVDAAHRKGMAAANPAVASAPKHDRFTGRISITPLGRGADNVEVELAAKFLAPNLLRYEVKEAGRKIARGRDSKGMWMRNADRIHALKGRDDVTDRRELNRHIRLARQLLSFLDPAATLRKTTDRSKVEKRPLQIGRTDHGECLRVSGLLEDFPLYGAAGKSAKVRIEVFTKQGLVLAIRAQPVDEKGRTVGNRELVVLDGYRPIDGVHVPQSLLVFSAPPGPQRETPVARIEIRALDLKPEIDAETFDRPTK